MRITDGCDNGTGGDGANAGELAQALGVLVLFGVLRDGLLAASDLLIEQLELFTGLSQQCAHAPGDRLVLSQPRQCAAQRAGGAPEPDAKLCQHSTGAIDQRGAFALSTLAHAVASKHRLLLDTLDRHETHVRLAYRAQDRLSIIAIVLRTTTLAEGLDELRSHELRPVTQAREHARPMMR